MTSLVCLAHPKLPTLLPVHLHRWMLATSWHWLVLLLGCLLADCKANLRGGCTIAAPHTFSYSTIYMSLLCRYSVLRVMAAQVAAQVGAKSVRSPDILTADEQQFEATTFVGEAPSSQCPPDEQQWSSNDVPGCSNGGPEQSWMSPNKSSQTSQHDLPGNEAGAVATQHTYRHGQLQLECLGSMGSNVSDVSAKLQPA